MGSDSSNWRPPFRTSPTDCVARTSAPFRFRQVFAASRSWPATIGSAKYRHASSTTITFSRLRSPSSSITRIC